MGTPQSIESLVKSKKAGGTIEANRVVKVDTTEGQVLAASAITDPVYGVSLHRATVGQAVSCECGSGAEVRVVAGEAITVGQRLMPKASGDGKVAVSAGATAVDCGIALTAGGDGETIVMQLLIMGKSPANA